MCVCVCVRVMGMAPNQEPLSWPTVQTQQVDWRQKLILRSQVTAKQGNRCLRAFGVFLLLLRMPFTAVVKGSQKERRTSCVVVLFCFVLFCFVLFCFGGGGDKSKPTNGSLMYSWKADPFLFERRLVGCWGLNVTKAFGPNRQKQVFQHVQELQATGYPKWTCLCLPLVHLVCRLGKPRGKPTTFYLTVFPFFWWGSLPQDKDKHIPAP